MSSSIPSRSSKRNSLSLPKPGCVQIHCSDSVQPKLTQSDSTIHAATPKVFFQPTNGKNALNRDRKSTNSAQYNGSGVPTNTSFSNSSEVRHIIQIKSLLYRAVLRPRWRDSQIAEACHEKSLYEHAGGNSSNKGKGFKQAPSNKKKPPHRSAAVFFCHLGSVLT